MLHPGYGQIAGNGVGGNPKGKNKGWVAPSTPPGVWVTSRRGLPPPGVEVGSPCPGPLINSRWCSPDLRGILGSVWGCQQVQWGKTDAALFWNIQGPSCGVVRENEGAVSRSPRACSWLLLPGLKLCSSGHEAFFRDPSSVRSFPAPVALQKPLRGYCILQGCGIWAPNLRKMDLDG